MKKSSRKKQNALSSFIKGLFEPAEENEIDFFSDEPDTADVIHLFDDDELEELGLDEDTPVVGKTSGKKTPKSSKRKGLSSSASVTSVAVSEQIPPASPLEKSSGSAQTAAVPSAAEDNGDDFWADTPALSTESVTPSSTEAAPKPTTRQSASFFLEHANAPTRALKTDITQETPHTAPIAGQDTPATVAEGLDITGSGNPEEAVSPSDTAPIVQSTDTLPTAEDTGDASVINLFDTEDAEETEEASAAPTRPVLHGTEAPKRKEHSSATTGTHSRTVRSGNNSLRITFRETESYRKNSVIRERVQSEEEHARLVKEEKRSKKKKKRVSFLKETALNIVFIGVIAAAVLVALWYTFLLREVVVVGNETFEATDIVALSGLQKGTHMLFCDLDAAEENLSKDPYLQVDDVEYIFPARVRIRITERKEAACIVGLDYNVIIDHSGYVLSMGNTDVDELLKITGVSISGFQLGQRIGQTTDFSTSALVSIISTLETFDLTDSITSIDMTTPLAVTMTADSGLKIFVGQPTDLADKIGYLYKILPSLTSSGVTSGTLYLSAKGGAVYSPVNSGATVTADTESDETAETEQAGTGVTYEQVEDTAYTSQPVATPQPTQAVNDDGFQG